MRLSVEDVIMIAGGALISFGVAQIHAPSGIITLGVLAVAYSVVIARARNNDAPPKQDAPHSSGGATPQGG